MTEIYLEISKLSDKFRTMAYGLTSDENEVNEAVQELMLYFLQANPEVIKRIYDKDGIIGITRYGAVALRRSLTSTRSAFYYKYKKYYTHIDEYSSTVTYNVIETGETKGRQQTIYNMPEVIEEYKWTKLEEIDQVLDKQTWYDKKIFEIYYSGETLDSLASKTGISRNSLFTTIDKVREILKKELNE